ncbi:MAG: hypothetical protein PHW95_04975 [Patescibacteria group bacterium]|nr:hypothetical protein [Patescibacteria group bacterium]
MGQQAGTFYAVSKEAIPTLPDSLREFVSRYFEEGVVFGQPCLVALTVNDMTLWGDAWEELGIGDEGVDEMVDNLSDWIEANPEVAFKYHLE